MIRFLNAGDMVTDSLGSPDYTAVANLGFKASSRYLRNLNRAEVERMWGAGIGVILNHETGNGNRALGGASNGDFDGKQAISQSVDLGWTGNPGIIYSGTDFDVLPNEYAICDSYYRAIADLGYPFGIYAGWEYLIHALTWIPQGTILWASAGWQFGTDPHPNMQQETQQQIINGVTVDVDKVISTIPVWIGDDPEMAFFRHNPEGVVYEFSDGYKWPVSGEYFYGALGGALFPNPKGLPDSPWSYQIDQAHFDAVPDGPIPSNNPNVNPAPTHFNITLTGTANA